MKKKLEKKNNFSFFDNCLKIFLLIWKNFNRPQEEVDYLMNLFIQSFKNDSYAEMYFPNTYFPDFKESEFDKALEEYTKRDRRFGKNK